MTRPDQALDGACFFLPELRATETLAHTLGSEIVSPCAIYLSGDLGSGKTAFSRGLIRSLGYNGRVKSPTFTLVETYNLSKFQLYHFDFYRFSCEDEFREAGFEELFDSDAVVLVEWPEQAAGALRAPDLWLQLEATDDEHARSMRAWAYTDDGQRCLNAMRAAGFLAQR